MITLILVSLSDLYSQPINDPYKNYFIQINRISFERIEDYLEAIAGEDPDNSIDDLLDKIDYYINNPVDLLYSSPKQIADIPGLSYFDAYAIYEAVKQDTNITNEILCDRFYFNEFQK